MWRNPLTLFRGAEYQRFTWATNKEPLTYYDMNLSAQDHQTFFTSEHDAGKPDYESEWGGGAGGEREVGWHRHRTTRPSRRISTPASQTTRVSGAGGAGVRGGKGGGWEVGWHQHRTTRPSSRRSTTPASQTTRVSGEGGRGVRGGGREVGWEGGGMASAQDHQTFFTSELDAGKPDYESEWGRGAGGERGWEGGGVGGRWDGIGTGPPDLLHVGARRRQARLRE